MTHPRPPARGHDVGRARLLGVSLLLLLLGAGLAYASLFRRWGYLISPVDVSTLSPEDRAALTVSWWDSTNTCCGPFPAIWPALALLCALPLVVPAVRHSHVARWLSRLGLASALCGFATVWLAVAGFVVRSWYADSGWVYGADTGTVAMALTGYALLFVSILVLNTLTRSSQPVVPRPAPDGL